MLEYAQSDTHFLLYIYDCVRSGLIDKAKSRSRSASRSGSPSMELVAEPAVEDELKLLKETLERSNVTSLRLYAPDVYDVEKGSGPGGWDTMARKWNKGALVYLPGDFTSSSADLAPVYRVQRNVYRALHLWRDKTAREEDESTAYVLPNHWLFTMSETPPTGAESLLGAFRGNVPAVVKRRVRELVDVVKEAVKRGLETQGSTSTVREEQKKQMEGPKQVVEEVVAMQVDQPVASVVSGKPDVFAAPSTSTNGLVAPSSSLFARKEPQAQPVASSSKISTPSSFLFGKVIKPTASASAPTTTQAKSSAFQEILSRINSTLVIAPSVSVILASSSTPATNGKEKAHPEASSQADAEMQEVEEEKADPVLGTAQAIAYVPASQRTTIIQPEASSNEMEDMGPIVVVGRKKAGGGGKKRKRAAAASAPGSGEEGEAAAGSQSEAVVEDGGEEQSTSRKASKKRKSETGDAVPAQVEEEQEAYDFASAPNVLDGKSRAKPMGKEKNKEKGKEKGKKGKKGNTFDGDFPAPPKARHEVKSGNMSVTFRSGK